MRARTALAVVGGVALTWWIVSAASSPAPSPTPSPTPGPPGSSPGDAAVVGDAVVASPAALAGVFPIPPAVTSPLTGIVLAVAAAFPGSPNLSGPVIGLVTSAGEVAIDSPGSFTVPRSSVLEVRSGGARKA